MEIILYTYFGINIFLAGYWFNENDRWESKKYTFIFLILSLLFGVFDIIFYCFLISFAPILGWVYKEISFQYRFYCTDYWDKILLDDNYSIFYKTREEKLERSEQLTSRASKQIQRHNKQVQKKYAPK